MIIWLNGAFAAGKTTLAEELHRRLPDAVLYDPEDIGVMLWKSIAPNDDFQDLPAWRELVVATALSLLKHHANTLIVPMSLLRDAYRDEIFSGLIEASQKVLHVFLQADVLALEYRLMSRVAPGDPSGWSQDVFTWAMSRNQAATDAAARQPVETLVLRSDKLTPTQLADAVLAEAGLAQG